MIRLTSPYQRTDQLSVRYISSCTKLYQIYQHTVHGGILMYHLYWSPIGLIHTGRYATV